jgi:hypothetical protein
MVSLPCLGSLASQNSRFSELFFRQTRRALPWRSQGELLILGQDALPTIFRAENQGALMPKINARQPACRCCHAHYIYSELGLLVNLKVRLLATARPTNQGCVLLVLHGFFSSLTHISP